MAAFHDLGKADTPFQQAVKAFSESHSVNPEHLSTLVNTLVEYCQVPTGHGKTEAAEAWLASKNANLQSQEHDPLRILPNWRQESVHEPLMDNEVGEKPSQQWPEGFFNQTFGSLQNTPLVRLPQGTYETRDEIE